MNCLFSYPRFLKKAVLAVVFIAFLSGMTVADSVVFFSEDFQSLSNDLQKVNSGTEVRPPWPYDEEGMWTDEAPDGWTVDNSGVASGGVNEFEGWRFMYRIWWVETSGDQDRGDYLLGGGIPDDFGITDDINDLDDNIIAVADGDEWSDLAPTGEMNTFLISPLIDITSASANTLQLELDSSWRPGGSQTAVITVVYPDITTDANMVEVLRYESDSSSDYYMASATDEHLELPLDNPEGAASMVIKFAYLDAGDDWWWAVDNIEVNDQAYKLDGSGTESDPYRVYTEDDFQLINYNLDSYYVLMNDIAFTGTYDCAVVAPDTDGSSSSFNGTVFSGRFDGNGYCISGLTIDAGDDGDYVGLFGRVEGGTVTNLGVVNCSISGDQRIGAVCGGLYYEGMVSNCYATGQIESTYSGGGVVGSNYSGYILECCFDGDVDGGNGNYFGGISGLNSGGLINNCFAVGTVVAGKRIGGVTGYNYNSGTVSYSHAANVVCGSDDFGGVCGLNAATVTACFWNTDVSGTTESTGGTGLTKKQMKDASNFTAEGWDFVDETTNGENDTWFISEAGYPKFTWAGTEGNPYTIASRDDLEAVNDCLRGYYVLMSDIDLSGYVYDAAIIAPDTDNEDYFQGASFTGVFDGNGHKISNLTISLDEDETGGDYAGLFGRVQGSAAVIKDLAVEDVNVVGTEDCDYVGALVGHNGNGTIYNCYSTGTVSGDYGVGGLVGYNSDKVINCYAVTDVKGISYVGGFCGRHKEGVISECYSTGQVESTEPNCLHLGGFVGTVETTINGCFWDVETSGVFDSEAGSGDTDGVIGLTTSEMQTKTTYTDSGWDFVDETDNGVFDCWEYVESGYPQLTLDSNSIAIPYKVYTQEDLENVNLDLTGDYVLMNDIILNAAIYSTAVIASDKITGDGFDGPVFSGNFDGSGHVINGLTIDGGDSNCYIGLLGYIKYGEIKNLKVTNCSITGYRRIGAVIGQIHNYASLTNCASSGSISGDFSVGGLVGSNYTGSIVGCASTASITPSTSDTDYMGGICGLNSANNLSCLLHACYFAGTVEGDDYVGGITGINYNGATLSDCYVTGSVVSKTNYAGGICGNNRSTVTNCYSAALISGTYYYDGICGSNTSTISGCFWDTQTSGIADSEAGTEDTDGMVGLTTAQMQTLRTYTDAGWDFIDETANGENDYWQLLEGKYPTFTSQSNSSWPVSYQVYTQEDLENINLDLTGDYVLMNDLDLSGTVYTTAVIAPDPIAGSGYDGDGLRFKGNFDGAGHTITGLTIDGADTNCFLALFGYAKYGVIENLNMEDCSIVGNRRLGAVCGQVHLITVSNCTSSGTLTGDYSVGGIIGSVYTSTVTGCSSTVSIKPSTDDTEYFGGICGLNSGNNISGSVNSCYFAGDIEGYDYVGGISGYNYNMATISDCYVSGSLSSDGSDIGGVCGSNASEISACFWDTQTTGITDTDPNSVNDDGVIGLTTAQMQTQSTFEEAGWDYINESANGTEDRWYQIDGDYPKLCALAVDHISADYDYDTYVNQNDLIILSDQWLTSDDYVPTDLDSDGYVNLNDLAIFARYWMGSN